MYQTPSQPGPECDCTAPPSRPPRRILNACVTVQAQVTARYMPPLAPPFDGLITLEGVASGFFVRGASDGLLYVVTAGHHVRFSPSAAGGSVLERVPPASGDFQKVNSLFVTVYGLGPSCAEAFFYRAQLVGVDGAGDIAVLRIDADDPWNRALPALGAATPALAWGESARARPGARAWVIGDTHGADPRSVCDGVVRDGAYASAAGDVVADSMLVSCPIAGGNSGSPILDANMRLIGMIDWAATTSFAGGPSQRFMQPVVERIIAGAPRSSLAVIPDVLGPYYRYLKGFLGISWVTANAFAFVSASGGPMGSRRDEGFEVTRVFAGGALDGLVVAGDIITHLDGVALGALPGQVLPTLQTWALGPGVAVTVTVLRRSASYGSAQEVGARLAPFPAAYDRALYGVASIDVPTTYSYGDVRRASQQKFRSAAGAAS